MNEEIAHFYGNKTRLRVCGLCFHQDKILVVNHKGLATDNFWAPPGGGIHFGEPVETALVREFLEETGLLIAPKRFLFVCEFIHEPLHALELFFEVEKRGGELRTGHDPETIHNVIGDVRFQSFAELMAQKEDERHGIFRLTTSVEELKNLRGFYRI